MNNLYTFLFFLFSITCSSIVHAQIETTIPIDQLENIDGLYKKTAKKKKKLLPVAIPITEPAVGYGLMAGVLLFLPKKDSILKEDMVMGGGAYTSNGTWFAGGGYLGFWKKDKIRYTGFSGYANVTLDYYGFGGENPVTFDQNIFIFMQQMIFRWRDSNFFLGGKYQVSKISIPTSEEDLDAEDLNLWNSGISLISEFDNLNNFMSPTKGIKVHLSYDQNLKLLGSQRDWGTLNFYAKMYFPINKVWIPAFRIESNVSTGRPPFYAFPYVNLRGIPALRYQGKVVSVIETEQLFNLTPRWGIAGFTGIGATYESVEVDKANEIVYNYGAGIRYLILKDMGLKIGIDIARGPEDNAFYMFVGSAW